MRYSSNNEVLTSAARGADTGSTNYIPAKNFRFAIVTIYTTAKTGSPWLDVSLQCSPVDPALDNSKWRTVYSETRLTNTILTGFPKIFGGHVQEDFSGWLRVVYEVGGTSTPTLTFSVNLELK